MPSPAHVVLFQGDSITDCGRDRTQKGANHRGAMGDGYAYLSMCRLLAEQSHQQMSIFNRGISGDKVPDLAQRWSRDCLALKPSLLSILVGINDLWHKLDGHYSGTPQTYETEYDELLAHTRRELPQVRLVIGEPFVLRVGVVNEAWFPEFEERRAVAHRLARRHGAVWVPFHEMFEAAVASGTPPAFWAQDGVHPTPAGHERMARLWCDRVRLP